VQNQALIVAAEYDSLKRGISDDFVSQIGYDLILSRFLSRAPTYLKATMASGNALLKRHLAFAFVSVLFSLMVSAAALAVGTWGSFFAYAQMAPFLNVAPPSHHEQPSASSSTFGDGGDDLSAAPPAREGKATSDAAVPADGQIEDKGAPGGRDWGGDEVESNDRPDRLGSFFGGLGPRPIVPYLIVIVLGSLFYFSYRREKEIELVVLCSGAVGLALAFTVDQFMRGDLIAIVPIAEILGIVVVPLCILIAALIRIGSVCVYALGTPRQGGRRAISTLLARAMAQATSGKMVSATWRQITRFWKDLAVFATCLALAILAASVSSMRWPALVVAVLILVGWCIIRRDLFRTALAWVRTEFSWKGLGAVIAVLTIVSAVVGGVGYGTVTAQSNFPAATRYTGFALSVSMATVVTGWMFLFLFEQPLRKFYYRKFVDRSGLERWSGLLKNSKPYQQSALLDNVDHQYFRVTPGEYYDAIVRLEYVIDKEPALSIYWRLRHEIEAVQRQQRGEE
jgi:hypothetical protein